MQQYAAARGRSAGKRAGTPPGNRPSDEKIILDFPANVMYKKNRTARRDSKRQEAGLSGKDGKQDDGTGKDSGIR